MTQNVAEREEKIRDLTGEVAELDRAEPEVLFQLRSPRRQLVTIYSTTDGEPIPIPESMVRAAMNATRADGVRRFAARKEDVPEYKLGDVKCFLHPDSPERDILAKIGLAGATCPAPHLASGHSKRVHAEHRHKQEWAALQEFLNDQKENVREARAERQLQATLDLARGASSAEVSAETPAETGGSPSGAPPSPVVDTPCQGCGKQIEGKLADHQCEV